MFRVRAFWDPNSLSSVTLQNLWKKLHTLRTTSGTCFAISPASVQSNWPVYDDILPKKAKDRAGTPKVNTYYNSAS